MGAILTSRITIITTLSESVGYKSGLALSHTQMQETLPDFSHIWEGEYSDILRIRSEEFAEIHAYLLYNIGNIPSPNIPSLGLMLYEKYQDNPRAIDLIDEIIDHLNDFLANIDNSPSNQSQPIDLNPFVQSVLDRYGPGLPISIVLDYYSYFQAVAHIDPWSNIRRIEWNETKKLTDLFESESLTTYYGHFFDQRFIDYLAANFQSIDNIHWRQFEGLVCEFFDREVFYVEIGRGRNDNNIDARIWPREEDNQTPPTILVQCKRQRRSVGKVVVKALWADIQAERASSGLIVTTSSLAVGAQAIATARAYPIVEANRENLARWILSMRTPNNGVFLGE